MTKGKLFDRIFPFIFLLFNFKFKKMIKHILSCKKILSFLLFMFLRRHSVFKGKALKRYLILKGLRSTSYKRFREIVQSCPSTLFDDMQTKNYWAIFTEIYSFIEISSNLALTIAIHRTVIWDHCKLAYPSICLLFVTHFSFDITWSVIWIVIFELHGSLLLILEKIGI